MADREQSGHAAKMRATSIRAPEVVLWVLIPVIAYVGYWWMTLRGLSVAGCEGDCRDELVFTTYRILPGLLLFSVVAALVTGIVLRLCRRRTLWVAASGLALVIAVLVAASSAVQIGFQPMYDRNDRIANGSRPPVPPPPDPTGVWVAQAVSQPAVTLTLTADRTVEGFDGCNTIHGTWRPGDEELIVLSVSVDGTAVCDGVDTWLTGATAASIHDGNLVIDGAGGSPIGVLFPSP